MTHTVWLITYASQDSWVIWFILYNFLKHSRTDSSKRTVRNVLSRTFAVVNNYVMITSSWCQYDVITAIIHPSLLILFPKFQKAYFCTDWNSWLVQKLIFQKIRKILFPYFPFSSIFADSLFWFCWLTVPPSPIPNTNKSFATLFICLFLAFYQIFLNRTISEREFMQASIDRR